MFVSASWSNLEFAPTISSASKFCCAFSPNLSPWNTCFCYISTSFFFAAVSHFWYFFRSFYSWNVPTTQDDEKLKHHLLQQYIYLAEKKKVLIKLYMLKNICTRKLWEPSVVTYELNLGSLKLAKMPELLLSRYEVS